MKRTLSILITFLLYSTVTYATHNRAGEITFKLISGYTYEVTITTFTFTQSAANRSQLTVEWGDNTASVAPLVSRTVLPNFYYHNIYTARHTFPGPGIYQILMQDPNRNFGILNIPNSVNVIFSIKTTMVISPDVGNNNTPVLLNFPIDKAAVGHIFIHNPSAFDPDGDSLSYSLTVCTGQDGKPIPNYTLPSYTDTFYVDPVVGDLVWDTPKDTGKYNVAMNISEWRKGVKIGNIVRDMQIDVHNSKNNPPVNPPLHDLCVRAGDLIEFQVTSTDADQDSVRQKMTGGPMVLPDNPATFKKVAGGRGFNTSTFTWQTSCNHVRKQPYQLTLKSEDNSRDISLVDIDNFNIRVLAPPPDNLQSVSTSTEIDLTWNQGRCGAVTGYEIYRREGDFNFIPDSCENGVPESTGYKKIAAINAKADTVYVDDNHGEGLVQGVQYCYIITAIYADGSESFASERTCNSLVPGFPAMLNVSVTQVDDVNGSIYISWAKPRNFDTTAARGPYVFKIYRSTPQAPDNFAVLDSILTADLNDTSYVDSPLNTAVFPYYYRVKMFNNTPGNRFEMKPNETETASSLYLDIVPGDNSLTLNIKKKAPWINTQYVIYRRNSALIYDSIATTNESVYVDDGLKNGVTYCYQVKSIGWRPIDSVIYNNANLSHINCGTPEDVTAPCAPFLNVVSRCDSSMNILNWTNPNRTCANDVVRYNIYFTRDINGNLDSLTSTFSAADTFYYHRMEGGTLLAGCYAVEAVDSFGNKSPMSARLCVDDCIMFELPNVFTPNGDNVNDKFVSKNLNNVIQKVDMKIFNRYGQLVYETSDPAINWDGSYKNTSTKVPTGVYYYICDVYEPRISGTEIRTLVGFIHLFKEGHAGEITK
jgi:gliding motility-associated-like protein